MNITTHLVWGIWFDRTPAAHGRPIREVLAAQCHSVNRQTDIAHRWAHGSPVTLPTAEASRHSDKGVTTNPTANGRKLMTRPTRVPLAGGRM